jgi:CO/xanthine dehydrogenase FAD-binding subunit
MKSPPFEYMTAQTVAEAVEALAAADGDAKLLAGGQSLVPMLNFRLLHPAMLVDINRIPGLDGIEEWDGGLRIGALARHYMLETSPLVAARFPVLIAAMKHVAHVTIRNRGTIGGSLSHADPSAELPLISVLLDAVLTCVSPVGRRHLAARDFFLGALTTALKNDEMVTEVALPGLPGGTGWGFEEFARRSGDFAIAAAAATVCVVEGRAADVRLAVTGMGEVPERMAAAEARLAGEAWDDDVLRAAAALVTKAVEPTSELHGSAAYRRHLAGVLTRRALAAAWRRAHRHGA